MTFDAIQKARQRQQSGALGPSGREGGKEQLQPGTIVIGGTSYACSVELGKIRYEMEADTGLWKRFQPLTATVKKTLLVTAPEKKSVIAFKGANYQVDEVGGQNVADIAWVLKAERKLPSPQ